jgi:hypothetical protein
VLSGLDPYSIRLDAAETAFKAECERVKAAETVAELKEGLIRLRAAASILVVAVEDYSTAKMALRYSAS